MQRIILTLIAIFFALPVLAQAPSRWVSEWPITDFSQTSVDFGEIIGGGPPKDGIPALASVKTVAAGDVTFDGREPVLTLELEGAAPRAYPLRYLTWHEIANDVVGGIPVAVTFCPLCNSGIIFDRRLDGQTLEFGVSGKLRNSDMIMFDRQTESWWQQFTGDGIVGVMTGKKLVKLVSWMESLDEFRARNPQGEVMAEPENYSRSYGSNPYAGYDTSTRPFLYRGENPPFGINPLARVVVVGNRAWPLERLQDAEELQEAGLRIVWKKGMATALGTRRIADGRDVGSIRVYDAITGVDVPHEVAFAFAFHAFAPDGEWMRGE